MLEVGRRAGEVPDALAVQAACREPVGKRRVGDQDPLKHVVGVGRGAAAEQGALKTEQRGDAAGIGFERTAEGGRGFLGPARFELDLADEPQRLGAIRLDP